MTCRDIRPSAVVKETCSAIHQFFAFSADTVAQNENGSLLLLWCARLWNISDRSLSCSCPCWKVRTFVPWQHRSTQTSEPKGHCLSTATLTAMHQPQSSVRQGETDSATCAAETDIRTHGSSRLKTVGIFKRALIRKSFSCLRKTLIRVVWHLFFHGNWRPSYCVIKHSFSISEQSAIYATLRFGNL